MPTRKKPAHSPRPTVASLQKENAELGKKLDDVSLKLFSARVDTGIAKDALRALRRQFLEAGFFSIDALKDVRIAAGDPALSYAEARIVDKDLVQHLFDRAHPQTTRYTIAKVSE